MEIGAVTRGNKMSVEEYLESWIRITTGLLLKMSLRNLLLKLAISDK